MTVRAVVMPAPHAPLELRMFADPALEPGGVLLETLGSEVCGTDVHLWHGRLGGVPYPIIPGHVSVGRVLETGGVVRDLDGRPVGPGDTVVFHDVYGSCGRCWHCTVAQAQTRCPERKVYGVTLSADDGLLGGWSERIELRSGVQLITLPEVLPWRRFLAAGCGLPTALHAVELGAIRFGDTVCVQGCGPVGICAIILAQLRGAGRVVALDGAAIRLATALAVGADDAIEIGELAAAERIEAVRELTGGRGADVTIEATGVAGAVPEGMRMTRDAGSYVIVGQYTDGGTTEINPHLDINRRHLQVRGCWGSDAGHLYRGLRVLERTADRFPWDALVSGEYPLERAQEALEDVAARRVVKALIVPGAAAPIDSPVTGSHSG